MHKEWQLQEAKNRFSEVVNNALRDGPQWVTRHGREAVVILSAKEFHRLHANRETLADFLLKSPLRGTNLDLKRDKSLPRDISL